MVAAAMSALVLGCRGQTASGSVGGPDRVVITGSSTMAPVAGDLARRFGAGVLGAVVVAAVAGAVLGSRYDLTGLEELELLTLDRRQRFFSDELRAASDDNQIVLVLFDSTEVRDWPYLSPFPRPVLAELIRSLSAAGARTIGLDVYLIRSYSGRG